MTAPAGFGRLLTSAEVAAKTVNRWGTTGKLNVVWSPGRRMRFWEAEILAMIDGSPQERAS